MATTYIQFTGRLKATSQEGILAEAQQVAISSTDNTNVKDYIDKQIAAVKGNISSVAGSVYRPKGSLTVANFKALTSAAVGDVYNITEQFTLSGRTYPAYTNVACVKAFSAAVTPDDSYWDALGGTVDLSPYAKTADVNTKVDTINKSISDNVSSLTTKISTAQSTANTANDTANANKTNISGLTTRVSTLEGSDHVNKINTVKVNGTALTPDGNKAVNIDISGKVDKVTGKGLSTNDYTTTDKGSVDWLQQYIRTDRNNVGYPFMKYSVDSENKTLNIDRLTGASGEHDYVNNIKIPLIDDKNGVFFDPFYYETYIQPLFNDEYALQTDVDKKVDKVDGKGLSKNDFTDAYKTKLDGIATGANKYVLPAATASALGGVKVGQVYASGTILPTVATVNLRASDNMAVVPAATTSAAGVMTSADKTKLNAIASTTRISPTENIGIEIGTGKSGFVVSDSGIYSYNEGSGYIVYIGTHVDIKTGVQIGTRTCIGEGAIIGDGANIGVGAVIDGDVKLKGVITIGSGVTISDDVKIGGGVKFGDEAQLGAGVQLWMSGSNLRFGTMNDSALVVASSSYVNSQINALGISTVKSNITSLTSRVTALENLLKLA